MALLTGSPAIDAGTNAALPADADDWDGDADTGETIPFDQRMTGFGRIWNSTVDIGASEYVPPPGNALSFDGANDYVLTDSFLTVSQVTAEAWVKSSNTGANAQIYNGNGPPQIIIEQNSGIWRARMYNGTSSVGQISGPAVVANVWTHLAYIYDFNNNYAELFVNGVSAGTATAPENPTHTSQRTIGSHPNPTAFFPGQIDEVRIWNAARTQAQIQDNMNRILAGNETGLVAYYRFDHVSGTTLADLTSNNNDATLINMTGNEWIGSAAFNTWTGAIDSNWNTASNWSRNTVPAITDNVGIPSGGNQPVISSATQCNHLVIGNSATLTVSGTSTLTVSGNFVSKGTFAPGIGTVVLNGGDQAIYGSNTFSNLTKNVAGAATLTFENGTTQAVSGNLDLQGASGNLLSLRSSSDGTQWQVNPSGTRTVAYLDVKDSGNTNGTAVNAVGTNTVDSGNNSGWNFSFPVIDQTSPVSQAMDEDGSPTPWTAPTVTASDGDGDTITWSVSTPATNGIATVSGTGASAPTFIYAPNADYNGSDSFIVQAADAFGSDTITVDVTVNAVNDTPSFTKGADQTVSEDPGAQSVSGWATSISKGPTDESGQTLTFSVSNDNNSLFSVQPATDASGNLTYTPAADANGSATVTVSLSDSGGGADTSGNQTFTITVNAVNDAPVITGQNSVSASEDTALTLGHHHVTVTDVDNSYPAGFGLIVQDGSNYTRSGNTVTPVPNFNGTLAVPVKVNDGAADSNVFNLSVTVTPVDDGPVVANAMADVTVNEDTADTVIGLGSVFTDIDNDDSAITKSVLSNSNPGLLSPSISGNTLTLDYQPDMNGSASITIRGTSNSKTVDDTFTVTVNAVDDGLTVANPIADVTADEDAANTGINLGAVFTDIDNDDSAILKTVQVNSNPGLVSATVAGNTLTLDYQPDMNGAASVTIRGTSNGKTADDTFTVTVNPVNDAPVITGQNSVSAPEETALAIGYHHVTVTDVDNPYPKGFGLIVQDGANYTRSGITVRPVLNFNGTLAVPVKVNDGAADSNVFNLSVTVTPADDGPVIANAIADVTVNEDSANTAIALGSVFTDVDNDVSAITKSVLSNSNPGLVSATITGNTLTLDYQSDMNGSGSITIRGTSNGKTADDTFTVTVNAADDGPLAANPIADVSVTEDAPNTIINLGNVFTDIDNDDAAIAKSVQSNSNTTLVAAAISGNTLTLDYQPDQNGTAHITILAASNGQTITDAFTITVTPEDDALTIANPIPDVILDEDAPDSVIDLGSVFTDIDNDDAAIAKSVQFNSNPSLISANINGNALILDFQENQNGAASVTVQGTSGGKTLDDTFTITVNAVDDPPATANPIPDITVDEDSTDTAIELGSVFTDIDNDDAAIAKSVQSNSDESLVTAAISGNTLTLDYQTNQSGTAAITVLATSNGQSIPDVFSITVNDVNSYISGQVAFLNNGEPVPGTLLTLGNPDASNPDASYTAITDETGAFLISSIPSGHEYVLAPAKDDEAGPETLGSTDASRIARAVVGLYELSDYERIAADVTMNGTVSGTDATMVAHFKLGMIPYLNDSHTGWVFTPDSISYFPLDSDMEDQAFAAVRLGYLPGNDSGDKAPRSRITGDLIGNLIGNAAKITADHGSELSVPVVLYHKSDHRTAGTAIEGIDIAVVFDENVLDATGATLAGGILENRDYELMANTRVDGRLSVAIFARSELFAGTGTVATLNFRVAGQRYDSSDLGFEEFRRNRSHVSGGFYVNDAASDHLRIIVEAENDLMKYDLNGDGRIGLQDAVRALRQKNPGVAIRALQCIVGIRP